MPRPHRSLSAQSLPMLSRRTFLSLASTGIAAFSAVPSVSWPGARSRVQQWAPGPSLPWAVQEVYCTTWNGNIVLAGGLRSGADSSREFTTLSGTALFDPERNEWIEGPDLPAPRHHSVLAPAGNMVFGFGGFIGEELQSGFQFRDDVYAFNGDEWERIGAMPEGLGETVALSSEGRIHLVTGSRRGPGEHGASDTHLVYDPKSDTWTTARPVPTARSSATGAVIDGKLYVAGGRTTTGGITNLGALERYDPETDEWTELRPLPQPAGGLAGADLNGSLYVFGGEYFGQGGGVYEHTWAYTPTTDEWTELPPMRTPRHGLAGAALNGRLYAIGGNAAPAIRGPSSTVVETFAPEA